MDSELFRWMVLPLLIFCARIADVSIGTVRIVFVSRGNKLIAPLLGFFEVLIWLLAIEQIMKNLSNAFCYVAYAGGFAAGTYVGLLIEEKLAIGVLLIRVITRRDASQLVSALRVYGFGVTNIPAEGSEGKVNVIYTVIKRADLKKVLGIINKFHPRAFYSIENIRSVREGIFPPGRYDKAVIPVVNRSRKGK